MKSTNKEPTKPPRKSGIPTGNAGEYFVMGELLRRGYDAQLADRNTKDYDILVGRPTDKALQKVQVKSVRSQPWYVSIEKFTDPSHDQVTIFVLLGPEKALKPVRYFIVKNHEVAAHIHCPANWQTNAFMALKAIKDYEDRWDILLSYTPEWIGESIGCIRRTMKALFWQYTEHFHPAQLNRYLALLIKQGRSYRTRNKYLQQMKAFVHWLQHNNLLDGPDPFRTIKALNQEVDPNRRIRRALTADEATKLCEAATVGPIVQGIVGKERALLYAFAITTGLRAKEIALLEVRDLVFDADLPYVVLPAGIAKARREDVLPIHPSVATRLEDWVATYCKNDLVFHLMTEQQTGGTGGKLRLTNRLMQADCKASGVPYKTMDGYADFHALRTTFCTNVCRLTDQFTAMKLARHTKASITARHYDKVLISARAKVVAALPAPSQP
jgi:integrase